MCCIFPSLIADPCTLPPVQGPCNSRDTRWYWEQKSRSCKHFIYSGCLGNSNNFGSASECESKCSQQRGQSGRTQSLTGRPAVLSASVTDIISNGIVFIVRLLLLLWFLVEGYIFRRCVRVAGGCWSMQWISLQILLQCGEWSMRSFRLQRMRRQRQSFRTNWRYSFIYSNIVSYQSNISMFF